MTHFEDKSMTFGMTRKGNWPWDHSELESYLEKIEAWQAAEDYIKAISRDGPTSQTFEQVTEELERTEGQG